MRKILYFLILITCSSCSTEKLTKISDSWLLFSIERLDLPYNHANKMLFFPESPREVDFEGISKDTDYQKWFWQDSLTIEFSVVINEELYSETEYQGY